MKRWAVDEGQQATTAKVHEGEGHCAGPHLFGRLPQHGGTRESRKEGFRKCTCRAAPPWSRRYAPISRLAACWQGSGFPVGALHLQRVLALSLLRLASRAVYVSPLRPTALHSVGHFRAKKNNRPFLSDHRALGLGCIYIPRAQYSRHHDPRCRLMGDHSDEGGSLHCTPTPAWQGSCKTFSSPFR
jgi:hypothetical protein